jgi:hypothetical protein
MPSDGHLDVFISYRSTQFSWAHRLAASLRAHGFTVFLDHDENGLRSREEWEPQLAKSIEAADHFLVLWSREIPPGSVVHTEIAHRAGLAGERPMSFLLLDDAGVPPHLARGEHHFRDFIDLYGALAEGDRAGGGATVSSYDWDGVVLRLVREQLRPGEPVHAVPVVFVAMTRTQADELQAALSGAGDEMQLQVSQLLAETVPFLPDAYGESPAHWRPFGRPGHPMADPITAGDLLSRLSHERMSWSRAHGDSDELLGGSYFFLDYTPLLWSDDKRKDARDHLKTNPSIVILDAISLLHPAVRAVFIGSGLPTAPKAFIIGVGPLFETETTPAGKYVQSVERALFKSLSLDDALDRARSDFYPQLSACLLNVRHRFELLRLLQFASDNIDRWMDLRDSRQDAGWSALLASSRSTPPTLAGRR